jgi:diguanylate cyclase (GGDEF)-like protein
MIKLNLGFNRKKTLVVTGVMLAGYLLLILSVTNVGQKRLEAARYNELHLKVVHYAELLGNYFELSRGNLNFIAKNKTVMTFFANKSSGMSMQYGLASSLFNVKQLIQQHTNNSNQAVTPLFSRITLLTLDGLVVADSAENIPFDKTNIDILKLRNKEQEIVINKNESGLHIRLSNIVYFNQKPIALLIADLNTVNIISLLTAQEYKGNGSYIRLLSESGNLEVWNSLSQPNTTKKTQGYNLVQEIKNTPFILDTWFQSIGGKDLFTSKWFVAIISLLAVPVFFSLYYLFFIERKNILLHAQINNSKRRRKALSLHNEQLEEEVKKRKLSEERLAYQTLHDALTSLPNRGYSIQKLNDAIDASERSQKKVLVMYIDLDNFKQVNDTLGHAAGDLLLQETSERLQNAFRKTDTVSRLSGDEFMVIINNLKDLQEASHLASKVIHLFDRPFNLNGHDFQTTCSIGLSLFPDDAIDAETLLKRADMALYKVKGNGRNNFSFYEPKMNDEVKRKIAINLRLREAIKNNKLAMYYQPLIDLKTNKIVGAEALMRWTDEELGFVPPDEFIAQAEKSNLIDQLGSFALATAAKQAADWQPLCPLQIAVNFSSMQFRDCAALLEEIQHVLSATNLPADKLDIELTESILINQNNELYSALKTLREMGIEISIDDFGTGYSALSYLQKYSFTKLKIDRSFIIDLTKNKAGQSLVTAIVAMAKALNLQIVAEGIEDSEQLQFLTDLGCEYGQGYLFSKPVPAVEFEKLLQAQLNN